MSWYTEFFETCRRELRQHIEKSGGFGASPAAASQLSAFLETPGFGIDEARVAVPECDPSPGEAERKLEGDEAAPSTGKRVGGVRHMARCGKCGTLVAAEQAKHACPTCGQKLQVVVVGFAGDSEPNVPSENPQAEE